MNDNLKDYLYENVEKFQINEDEKKEIYEYIEELASSFENI